MGLISKLKEKSRRSRHSSDGLSDTGSPMASRDNEVSLPSSPAKKDGLPGPVTNGGLKKDELSAISEQVHQTLAQANDGPAQKASPAKEGSLVSKLAAAAPVSAHDQQIARDHAANGYQPPPVSLVLNGHGPGGQAPAGDGNVPSAGGQPQQPVAPGDPSKGPAEADQQPASETNLPHHKMVQPGAPPGSATASGAGAQAPEASFIAAAPTAADSKGTAPGVTPGTTGTGTVVKPLLILQGLVAVWLLFVLLLAAWLRPGLGEVFKGVLSTLPVGLGLAVLFGYNRKRKADINAKLNVYPGIKGLTQLLGYVPTWVAFDEREKVEWMNKVVTEMWPFIDRPICAEVRRQVEPVLEQFKPPGIKAMYFKKLTFGRAPFKVERVWVEDQGEDHLCMEVDFRWAGDADIQFAVEFPVGGHATRMVPKMKDIAVSGTVRVVLRPFCNVVPGFGAVTISLRDPPMIRYNLSFGKALGGSTSANAIRLFLDDIIDNVLLEMMVWPNRMVFPMLPEEVTGPLDDLELRHQGVLTVDIIEAKDVKPMDANGKADPMVKLWTTKNHTEHTKVQHKTLDPVWNERKFVFVQEPKTQYLYLEMYEHDSINVKELLRVNVFKGASKLIGSLQLVGRQKYLLDKVCAQAGQPLDVWVDIGPEEFATESSCGKGLGKLHLSLNYTPFEMIKDLTRTPKGAVLLTVKKASKLPAADAGNVSDPYVTIQLGSREPVEKTRIIAKSLDPVWQEKFEWHDVDPKTKLKLKVTDSDFMGNDVLGELELDVYETVVANGKGFVFQDFPLTNVLADGDTGVAPPATITIHLRYVPLG